MKARLPALLPVLAAVCLLAQASLAHAAVSAQWTPFGPGGGGIYDVAVDPATPDTLYAAAGWEGIYKSTDHGESWEQIAGDPLQYSYFVGSVALDPVRPSVLYAAVEAAESEHEQGDLGTVYRSVDGGQTWEESAYASRSVLDLAVTADAVFAVSSDGYVLRTTDGGESWTEVFRARATGFEVHTHPALPGTVFVATASGIHKSTDNGSTWRPLLAIPGSPLWLGRVSFAVSPANPAVLYVSFDHLDFEAETVTSSFLRSNDGGATWQPGTALPAVTSSLAVDPVSSSVLHAATVDGLFVSRDAGSTWRRSPGAPADFDGIGGEQINRLIVDPVRPIVYAGTLEHGLYQNRDSRRWAPVGTQRGLLAGTYTDVAVHPRSASTIYVSLRAGEGLFRTTDGGATWTRTPASLRLAGIVHDVSFDPADPNTHYAAAHRGLFRSTDGGSNWTSLGLKDARAVAFPRRGTLVAAACQEECGIYRSTDNGRSWSQTLACEWYNPPLTGPAASHVGEPACTVEDLQSHPAEPATIYAQALIRDRVDLHVLYKSTNGGATWTEIGQGTGLVVDPHRRGRIYAARDTRVYRSDNGGRTWTGVAEISGGGLITDLLADLANPSTLYAATTWGLYSSTDGGVQWQPMGGPPTDELFAHPIARRRIFATSRAGGLFSLQLTRN